MEINKINALEKQPLVSVVIPVYNVEAYLRECLDSVCGQTYRNLEIILVDDGSRDHSGALCDEIAESDSRVICIHKENGGLSSARNCGMDHAHGDYLMFVDSDDWIELNAVEQAVTVAENEKAGVVMWNYIREYAEGSLPTMPVFDHDRVWRDEACREIYLRVIGPISNQLSTPATLDSLSSACMKLYRRDLVTASAVRFVDHAIIGSCEDTLFHIQLFRYVRCFVYMTADLYHYRKTNDSSITRNCNRQIWFQRKNMFALAGESLEDRDAEALAALQNRIACSLIGMGLVLIHPAVPRRERKRDIFTVLHDPLYHDAVKQLNTKSMPPHWKLFFLFAKWNWTGGVYALLRAINYLKRRM